MRNVMVTGATRGIGLAIAKVLAGAGYRVIAVGRSRNGDFDAAVAAAAQAGRGAIVFKACDLGVIDSLSGLVRESRKELGPLFALVNNAGIGTHGLLATMPTHDIEKLVRINTLAPMVLTKHVVRHMMADGGGRIVNLASIASFTGFKAMAAYAATKASMVGFTRSLAREVGPQNICVNAIAPGFLATDMTDGLGEAELQRIMRRSALQRLAEVDDVAVAVEFLLGATGRNITGTVLTIDAGSTA